VLYQAEPHSDIGQRKARAAYSVGIPPRQAAACRRA
jgi:hypothetical protein